MKCVEVQVHIALRDLGCPPQFEGMVRRTELQRGQALMMVAVDESGQHHMLRRAQCLVRAIFRQQILIATYFDNYAARLKYRAVVDYLRFIAPDDLADDVLPTNE